MESDGPTMKWPGREKTLFVALTMCCLFQLNNASHITHRISFCSRVYTRSRNAFLHHELHELDGRLEDFGIFLEYSLKRHFLCCWKNPFGSKAKGRFKLICHFPFRCHHGNTDYMNSSFKVHFMLSVFTFAARVLSGKKKYEHITPTLKQLKLLPI